MKDEPSSPVKVDSVVIGAGADRREVSLDEFFAMPLSQRIRAILERSVTFYGAGRELDRNAALDSLRRSAQPGP
jgi:hypothetical protein